MECLYGEICNGFDVAFGHYLVRKKDGTIINYYERRFKEVISIDENYNFFDSNHEKRECWGILFKKEILKTIRFNENISVAEDFLFVIQSFKQCNRVVYLANTLYNYRELDESLMHGSVDLKKATILNASKAIIDELNSYKDSLKTAFSYLAYNTADLFYKSWVAKKIDVWHYVNEFLSNNKRYYKRLKITQNLRL